MKRLFLIVLGVSICLFLANYSASETNAQAIDNSNKDQTTNQTDYNDTITGYDVPPCLDFGSFEKIAELKDILRKDESKVVEYLDENNYSMNGLSSKSDIYNFFNIVDGLNMLHLDSSSGYYLSSVQYSWLHKNLEYVYKSEDKMIRIHCYVDPDGTDASKIADILQRWNVADKIEFGGEEIVLYYPSGESSISFRCCVNTSNSLMDVRFYDDDINAAKDVIEKYAISTTLNELLEQENLQTFVKIAACGLITSFMLLLSMISCFKKSRNDINEKRRLKKATFIMSILSFVMFWILEFMRFSTRRDFVFWIFLIWYVCLNISIALYVISAIKKSRKKK